jgi:hypothetical protein
MNDIKTVWDLVNELNKYDKNLELEIQYWDQQKIQAWSWPSIDWDINVYQDDDWYETPRVIIDLWSI